MAKKRKKKWVQKAISRPGALRKTAKRMGLIKGEEKLSASDLNKLERHAERTKNQRLEKQVHLARTLKGPKVGGRKKKKKKSK